MSENFCVWGKKKRAGEKLPMTQKHWHFHLGKWVITKNGSVWQKHLQNVCGFLVMNSSYPTTNTILPLLLDTLT